MPFENLYFRYDAFRDHNFNTFLDRLEPVPEEYIEARIREAVLAGKEIEPYFGPIIPLTLSPKSCASFIRTHPQLPISDRDYYLSKVFQFMYLPIAIALEPDHEAQDALRERLEGILDRIPGMVLPELQHLAWWAFLSEVRSRRDAVDWHVDLNAIMATLSHWLPNHEVTEPAPLKPQATPAELLKARRELVAEVIRRTGDSKSSLYRAAKVDKADFYRWSRGQIKSTSAMSLRIETSLKRRLQ